MLDRLRCYADLAKLLGLLSLLVVVLFIDEGIDKLRPLVGLERRDLFRGWGEPCSYD